MKKYKLVNKRKFLRFIVLLIFISISIPLTINFFLYPEKYLSTWKLQLKQEIEKEVPEALEYYKENYVDKNISLFEDVQASSINTNYSETEIEPVVQSFTVTAYCCCEKCCGKNINHPAYGVTATGTKATEGRTIAVDPNVIPLGSTVYLNNQPYIAEDTGSAIKGNKIDIFINDHQRAQNFGVQKMEIYYENS